MLQPADGVDYMAQSTSRMISTMNSYNVRLAALEQISPLIAPAWTPIPPMTMSPLTPLPSASVTVVYDVLISQAHSRAPHPPPDHQ